MVLIGPPGVGKTTVAERIAPRALRLDTTALSTALLRCVREGGWSDELRNAPALILDGPVWLRGRMGVVELLKDLIDARKRAGRKTVLCQCDTDGSIDELIGVLRPGSSVVIGLRFPKGKRGRLRFARRVCEELGAPREAARGTDQMEPWRYEAVTEVLRRWPDPCPELRQARVELDS